MCPLGTSLLRLNFYLLFYAACSAHKICLLIMLKNKNCTWSIITIYVQICMNNSLLTADKLERLFYQGALYKWQQIIYNVYNNYVLIDNDCSIRVYQSIVGIMHYAQNYTSIIDWSLVSMTCELKCSLAI